MKEQHLLVRPHAKVARHKIELCLVVCKQMFGLARELRFSVLYTSTSLTRRAALHDRNRHVILNIRRPGATEVARAVAVAALVFVEGTSVSGAFTAVRKIQGVATAVQVLPSGPKAASMGARALAAADAAVGTASSAAA